MAVMYSKNFFIQRAAFVRMVQRDRKSAERIEQGLPVKTIEKVPLERSYAKIIRSGSIIETFEYQKPVLLCDKKGGRIAGHKSERNDENRRLTTRRARNNIRRLVNMNFSNTSKFITLTFRDNEAAAPQLKGERPNRGDESEARNVEGCTKGGATYLDRTNAPRTEEPKKRKGTKPREETLGASVKEREGSPSKPVKRRAAVKNLDIRDVKQTNVEFKKFIQRLRRYVEKLGYEANFKYLAVIEFQDEHRNGVVHYHMIADLPYLKHEKLSELWGLGFCGINAIDSNDNIGAYMVKYMMKDLGEPRLMGCKAYLVSKGMQKSEVITGEEAHAMIQEIEREAKKNRVYENVYPSEYLGNIQYTEYNMQRETKKTRKQENNGRQKTMSNDSIRMRKMREGNRRILP